MNPNVVGALINSALYLACVFIAGIVTAHPIAWKLALVAMGVTYLQHLTTLPDPSGWLPTLRFRLIMVLLSIALGLAAGIALLF